MQPSQTPRPPNPGHVPPGMQPTPFNQSNFPAGWKMYSNYMISPQQYPPHQMQSAPMYPPVFGGPGNVYNYPSYGPFMGGLHNMHFSAVRKPEAKPVGLVESRKFFVTLVLPQPYNVYKSNEEVAHHESINVRMQDALRNDQKSVTRPVLSEFRNMQDAVDRLLAYHIYQVPQTVQDTKEATESEIDGLEQVEQRFNTLLNELETYLRNEPTVKMYLY